MARTSAERQAAYRAKRTGPDSAECRFSTWISRGADAALTKFSLRYGVTKRDVIELLLLNEGGRLKDLAAEPVVGSGRVDALLRRNVSRKKSGGQQKAKEADGWKVTA